MRRISQTLCGGVVYALVCSSPAVGMDVGAYAVSNHRPCGVSNLPATTREMEKFFADKNFSTLFERNFYWKNEQVNQRDWSAEGDYTVNESTASGFNGIDASNISYIASHGVTSRDIYRASMGSRSYGGCEIRSDHMFLGDQNARYLILSTCQGVKIGSGDYPRQSGANPSRTWNPERVNGLNCIFGYSNNMADADRYGTVFLNYLTNNDEPVTDSFLRAGRAVASFNVPAVICFGATEEDAQERITSEMSLSTDPAEGGASAYSYEVSRDLPIGDLAALPKIRTNRITAKMKPLDLEGFKHLSGHLSENLEAGTVTYRRDTAHRTIAMNLSDDETIEIATRFLSEQLQLVDEKLEPIRIVERGLARGLEEPQVIGKTVVFAQDIYGMRPLSTAGTLEIYVDGLGEVAGFHYALREISGKLVEARSVVTAVDLEAQVRDVINLYEARYPEADKVAFYRSDLGYDLGADVERKASAELVHQVVVEVTQGDYARRHIEPVLLP